MAHQRGCRGLKAALATAPQWQGPQCSQSGGGLCPHVVSPGGPKAAKPRTQGGGLLSGPHVGQDPSSTWWGPRWSLAVGGPLPMRWGLGPSERRRPPLQTGGWLGGRKEVEAPTPMPEGPQWSHIRGGLCATPAGPLWSQRNEGPNT